MAGGTEPDRVCDFYGGVQATPEDDARQKHKKTAGWNADQPPGTGLAPQLAKASFRIFFSNVVRHAILPLSPGCAEENLSVRFPGQCSMRLLETCKIGNQFRLVHAEFGPDARSLQSLNIDDGR
jgi:hypothetical protein